jgi:RNA polymerase sigma-70 factor (ECF subfamily)
METVLHNNFGGMAGELADFDELVRTHSNRIFRFIFASTRDRDAADSLTQDCFLRAYKARHQFRGDSSAATWLMKIAVNLVRSHALRTRLQFWRSVSTHAVPYEDVAERLLDRGGTPEALSSARQQVRAVWDVVGRLPQRQRTIFLLRFVDDMELTEIAAAIGMKEATVKTHLYRALQTVRDQLGRPL